jgi:hypothetical protein
MRSKSVYTNGCANAHLNPGHSESQMTKSPLSGALEVVTPVQTQYVGEYFICYATVDSGGDSGDDFTQLTQLFTTRIALTFAPNKTVAGAPQLITVKGASYGDQVSWTTKTICTAAGNSGPDRSWTYFLDSAQKEVPFHVTALPGIWTMCFQPAGGFATLIPA